MNKRLIEYLIIATVIVLLIYGFATMMGYKYPERKDNITDSISMYHPTSSSYKVDGDTVEFRNILYDFYNMDVSKLNSSNERVTNLLNHYANFGKGGVDYLNENSYLVTVEFEDGSGFKYHSMVIPIDSFNKNDFTFNDTATVYLFEGNNRNFVTDSAFNSQVVL